MSNFTRRPGLCPLGPITMIGITGLCISILLGCNRQQPVEKEKREPILNETATDRPYQILRHNEMTTSVSDWKLITWTTGTTYSPGEPIDIGLHLTFMGQGPKPIPKGTVRLNLQFTKDAKILSRELTVPFKELKDKVSEWEAIMIDVFNTDSHREGASILEEGDYLLEIEVATERAVVLRPLDSMIKIDNVDKKNLIDHYREHYPNYAKHNVMTSSVGAWGLTAWTTASLCPPGTPIELGLHLAFSGPGPKPIPKATVYLNLKDRSGTLELNRQIPVPFKETNNKAWEAIMADVFKTDSHRAGASILKEGAYHIKCVIKVDNEVTIPVDAFSIEVRNYQK